MKKESENFLDGASSVRPARKEDVDEIIAMVRELAEFERLGHEMVATAEDYERALFGEPPEAGALVAEIEGRPVGCAIYHTTFSTFVGRSGIWLEDLYVRPGFRRRGIGKSLLKAVGDVARERGAGRYEWTVLDWNRNAIELYEKMGGRILDEWRTVRLEREGIEQLSEK